MQYLLLLSSSVHTSDIFTYHSRSIFSRITFVVSRQIGLGLSVSLCLSVCEHSHGRISWSIFTKIGKDVRTPKSKNEFVGGQYLTTPSPMLPPIASILSQEVLKTHANIKYSYICPKFTRIAEIFATFRKSGTRNTMVTSDFRPELKIYPFRACAMHPAIIIGTVRSLWTWLWSRYHVPQNVFLVKIIIFFGPRG